ncbi:iron complex transport system ATP-binding protein [Actinopolyspora xinjiangensis]|uniref:Iron complex transport system ATP-binding protein n=1 Tax=Actinopolyspora xinjiangensis TaxID=405564 RepID=A0A1H0WXR5_9ACTN|nr:ABC transporter ATP-binding protein [Actinopolyspora xinjiangensis]SDP95501.1 iron complex transport system ATP-binding protein [Actinopolyspora xinjiangensis]
MTASHTANDAVAHTDADSPSGHGASETARNRLRARDLSLGYGDRVVVDGLDLDVVDGTITGVIGPNGCGKSTLLRALGRLLQPKRGSVLLDGEPIHRMSTKEVARRLGLLPQSPAAPEGLCVADLVARGRHPHQAWYRQWSSDDESAVAEALALTGIEDLADRSVDELSGGQRQRAWLSMALAQGTDLLLLDEPTTYLDLSHQVDVLELIGRLHAESGRTVVMVLHDLNLAARYADRLVAMSEGRIAAEGVPEEVLTERLLREVFDLSARVIPDPVTGTPMVVPVGGRQSGVRNRMVSEPGRTGPDE